MALESRPDHLERVMAVEHAVAVHIATWLGGRSTGTGVTMTVSVGLIVSVGVAITAGAWALV